MATIIETEGIILRTLKYSETSIIMDVFTKDFGLKSCIVSGVRSAKSKSPSPLYQVMNIISFSYYKKELDQLHRIKECHYAHTYQNLQVDVIRSSVGVFIIECSRNCIKEKEENLSLYDFIKNSFIDLDTCNKSELGNFYIYYLIQFSSHLGFYPLNNYSTENYYFDLLNGTFTNNSLDSRHTMDAESSVFFSKLIEQKIECTIPRESKEKIVDYLLIYYALHIENFRNVKSLEVLREVMR